MPKPRQLIIVLVTAVAVITAASMMKLQILVSAAATFLIGCVLVDGLWEGEISFGMRSARRRFRKKDTPFAFWTIICLHIGFVLVFAYASIKGASAE